MRRDVRVLLAGIGLIVISNTVVLLGVAYNRSGNPDSVVKLTERELALPSNYAFNREDTGLALILECRLERRRRTYSPSHCRGNPPWLDQPKLVELGFELPPDNNGDTPERYNDSNFSRDAFLVLQFDGDAYKRVLQDAEKKLEAARLLAENNPDQHEFKERFERAREVLENEQSSNSRLFAVDAGSDKTVLRQRYPDTTQYIIVTALVKPVWERKSNDYSWTGWITDLPVDRVNLPLEYRSTLEAAGVDLQRQTSGQPPRYNVTVAHGKRTEPWIISVSTP